MGVAAGGRSDGVVSVFFRVRVLRYRGPSISERLCARGVGAANEQQMQALALGAFFAAARRADARFSIGRRSQGLFEAYERRGQAPPMLLSQLCASACKSRETRFVQLKEPQKPELHVLLDSRPAGERGKRRLRRFPRPSTSIQKWPWHWNAAYYARERAPTQPDTRKQPIRSLLRDTQAPRLVTRGESPHSRRKRQHQSGHARHRRARANDTQPSTTILEQ